MNYQNHGMLELIKKQEELHNMYNSWASLYNIPEPMRALMEQQRKIREAFPAMFSVAEYMSKIAPAALFAAEINKAAKLANLSMAINPTISAAKHAAMLTKHSWMTDPIITKAFESINSAEKMYNYLDNLQPIIPQLEPFIHEIDREDANDCLEDSYNNLSTIEKEELTIAINETVSDPNKSLTWIEKLKGKPSVKVFIEILKFLYIALSIVNFGVNIVKETYLRKEPSETSTVIQNITINQTVHILDQVSNFCKVWGNDIETGEEFEGWINKDALSPNDSLNSSEKEDNAE